MILQNYWAWQKYIQSQADVRQISNITGITDTSGTAVTTLYGITSGSPSASILQVRFLTTNTANNTLVFGSGSTAPTALDYAMENDLSASLTSAGTITINYESGKMELIYAYTVTNSSAEAITISEVGIKKIFYTSMNTTADVLIAREILSTPISVGAGETKSINYVWTMQ